MRRRAMTVQDAGFCEKKRARAHASGTDPRSGLSRDERDQPGLGGNLAGSAAAANQHGVERGRSVDAQRMQARTAGTADGPPVGGEHDGLVERGPVFPARDFEGRRRAGGVQQLEVGEEKDSDPSQHG